MFSRIEFQKYQYRYLLNSSTTFYRTIRIYIAILKLIPAYTFKSISKNTTRIENLSVSMF